MENNFNTSYVVIKQDYKPSKRKCQEISIHLMLLLNAREKRAKHQRYAISIHLMLLLNIKMLYNNWGVTEFQYILCCY